jgi:hypothetical protein
VAIAVELVLVGANLTVHVEGAVASVVVGIREVSDCDETEFSILVPRPVVLVQILATSSRHFQQTRRGLVSFVF